MDHWLHAGPLLLRARLPKHAGQLCAGLQIHGEDPKRYDHAAFRSWPLQALPFKVLRTQAPDCPLWRDFLYEFKHDWLAIDLINGGPALREWVEDAAATAYDLEALARPDETDWAETRKPLLLY